MIITSDIKESNFRGIVHGPVDIFSNEFIISCISLFAIWAIIEFIDCDFLK